MQNGHKNNIIPVNAPVIPTNAPVPANAGTKTERHARFPSPMMGEGQSPPRTRSGGEGEHGGNRANSNERPKVDVEAARKSMARMANIFAEIAQHAEESTIGRCPYKDARSRCTAKFGCRNQHFTKNPINPPICTAKDGDLNYRSAWEI